MCMENLPKFCYWQSQLFQHQEIVITRRYNSPLENMSLAFRKGVVEVPTNSLQYLQSCVNNISFIECADFLLTLRWCSREAGYSIL